MLLFKKLGLLFVFTSLLTPLVKGQDIKPVYFEKVSDSLMRFYYDNFYYLTEKDCQFKSIERVAGFDKESNTFNGDFKDFGPNGHVALTGSYKKGLKSGPFKAYHPNGIVKWEVSFIDNQAQGEWKFYYPDGQPMLILLYQGSGLKIMSFWNQKRKQLIQDGNGVYDFTLPFEGYTEYGYPFLKRRGKVVNGLPEDRWTVQFVDEKKNAVLAAEEYYRAGALVRGDDYFKDESYSSAQFPLLPMEYFLRSEFLIFKKCNFDDYSNFTNYLKEKIEKGFEDFRLTNGIVAGEFEYTVKLSSDGDPKSTEFPKRIEDHDTQVVLMRIVNDVPYYFPSLKDGQPVNDNIVISGRLEKNASGGVDIHSLTIKRPAEG
jgi:antitoxin component YwqK of YwqJK toxin-antitoxin module